MPTADAEYRTILSSNVLHDCVGSVHLLQSTKTPFQLFILLYSFSVCSCNSSEPFGKSKRVVVLLLQVRKQDETRGTDSVSTELLAQIERLTQSLAQAQDDGAQALAELQAKYVTARRSLEEAEERSGTAACTLVDKHRNENNSAVFGSCSVMLKLNTSMQVSSVTL